MLILFKSVVAFVEFKYSSVVFVKLSRVLIMVMYVFVLCLVNDDLLLKFIVCCVLWNLVFISVMLCVVMVFKIFDIFSASRFCATVNICCIVLGESFEFIVLIVLCVCVSYVFMFLEVSNMGLNILVCVFLRVV